MTRINRRSFLQQTAGAGIGLWMASHGHAAAPNAAPLRTVTLEGTALERGLVHGKTLREPIHQLIKLWKADLAERYKMEADAFIKALLKRTEFPAAIKKWTPDLLDEVSGIAQGAGIDFDTMLVFQLIDEYWVHGPGVAGEHCSALGIAKSGDRPSYVAQTMDLEGFRSGFQAVLHIKQPKSKREALVVTHAGLIGLNGLNNHSIGICCNTLGQLAYCSDGLPVACVVRGVLERDSEKEAVDFLQAVKHASGQNYVIGGPEKVYDFECSAGKVTRFTPAGGPSVVWHTNHPLVNDDYNAGHRQALEKKETEKKEANTRTRLQSLEKRLGKEAPVPGLDLIKATLASKDSAEFPVCRPYKDKKENCTFAATIMVLAAKRELHVTAGPPDVQPYGTLAFSP
jgi:hypothetical protein